jgi:hypothetical protein
MRLRRVWRRPDVWRRAHMQRRYDLQQQGQVSVMSTHHVYIRYMIRTVTVTYARIYILYTLHRLCEQVDPYCVCAYEPSRCMEQGHGNCATFSRSVSRFLDLSLSEIPHSCCGPILPFFHTDKLYQPADIICPCGKPVDIICPCEKMVK